MCLKINTKIYFLKVIISLIKIFLNIPFNIELLHKVQGIFDLKVAAYWINLRHLENRLGLEFCSRIFVTLSKLFKLSKPHLSHV